MHTFSLLSIAAGPSHNRPGDVVLNTSAMRPAARMGCLIMTLACPKPLSLYRPRDSCVSDLWRLSEGTAALDNREKVYTRACTDYPPCTRLLALAVAPQTHKPLRPCALCRQALLP